MGKVDASHPVRVHRHPVVVGTVIVAVDHIIAEQIRHGLPDFADLHPEPGEGQRIMVGNIIERLVKAAVIPAQQGVGDKGVQLQPALAVEHVKLFCHTDSTAHLRAGRYALRFEHRQVGQSRKADEPR